MSVNDESMVRTRFALVFSGWVHAATCGEAAYPVVGLDECIAACPAATDLQQPHQAWWQPYAYFVACAHSMACIKAIPCTAWVMCLLGACTVHEQVLPTSKL